ncbi:MAG: sodium:proton exchanger [Spirochaetaceae bacterium]|nr:sodium:proton exchanger [Spirochaetaceae bacterium]|tara:strand:+ start:49046 stop:50047 length:1002 start_codon:yes stop_codon:yes gene_type:complete
MAARMIPEAIQPYLPYILFLPGFYLLIKGADWLVEGASSIARRLRVSDLIIGLTIVSFGTSMPELAVNIIASFQGSADLAVSNVVGSNIANILLILGVTALVRPLTVQSSTVWKEIPFSFLAVIVLFVVANDRLLDGSESNMLSRSDGLTVMLFFAIFMYYVVNMALKGQADELLEELPEETLPVGKAILFTILGMIALPLGGDWIVDGAVTMARGLNVGEDIIGLSIVAIGTSLPELAASVVAARKGNSDIAVGNVVGSNIFNIFWVLGLSMSIRPIPFSKAANLDLFMVIVASLLLFLFIFVGKRHTLERGQGVVFLFFYVAYLLFRGFTG